MYAAKQAAMKSKKKAKMDAILAAKKKAKKKASIDTSVDNILTDNKVKPYRTKRQSQSKSQSKGITRARASNIKSRGSSYGNASSVQVIRSGSHGNMPSVQIKHMGRRGSSASATFKRGVTKPARVTGNTEQSEVEAMALVTSRRNSLSLQRDLSPTSMSKRDDEIRAEIMNQEHHVNVICSSGSESYLFECPHCCGLAQVNKKDINCTVFRHGVFKSNMQPIPPHSTKAECKRLLESGLIHGCGKPFLFDGTTATGTDEYN